MLRTFSFDRSDDETNRRRRWSPRYAPGTRYPTSPFCRPSSNSVAGDMIPKSRPTTDLGFVSPKTRLATEQPRQDRERPRWASWSRGSPRRDEDENSPNVTTIDSVINCRRPAPANVTRQPVAVEWFTVD